MAPLLMWLHRVGAPAQESGAEQARGAGTMSASCYVTTDCDIIPRPREFTMRKYLLPCAIALAAGTAHADPPLGLYVGAGVTSSSVSDMLGIGHVKNTEWKALTGIKPAGSLLGFEAEYLDFGSANHYGAPSWGEAYAYDAVGYIPLPAPFLSLLGKAGLARWEFKSTDPYSFGALTSVHSYQFTWGAGAQARFGRVGVRLEFERFNIRDPVLGWAGHYFDTNAHVITLGVLFTLL
jgi:hypothetical protein